MAPLPLMITDIALSELSDWPRNYRRHPAEQVTRLVHSLKRNGQRKAVVVQKKTNRIIAGHGVVEAARSLGWKEVRCDVWDVDDEQAERYLIGDNELWRTAEDDDRLLTEMLKELNDTEIGLESTGFDEEMLANLLFVTRPASEIADFDAAEEWVGMPEYDEEDSPFIKPIVLVMRFRDESDRDKFIEKNSLVLSGKPIGGKPSAWWPPKVSEHAHDFRFKETADE